MLTEDEPIIGSGICYTKARGLTYLVVIPMHFANFSTFFPSGSGASQLELHRRRSRRCVNQSGEITDLRSTPSGVMESETIPPAIIVGGLSSIVLVLGPVG